jgi:hypothetical protein
MLRAERLDDSAARLVTACGDRYTGRRIGLLTRERNRQDWGIAVYPIDQAGRQQLADELTAKGLKPTQTKQHFDRDKTNRIIDAMKDGSFDWNRASLQPVILGPDGEVMGGHHPVLAAHLALIDLMTVPGPRPQIRTLLQNFRAVFDWIDVLPDVP